MEPPPWSDWLQCPLDGSALTLRNGALVSESGRRYPVIHGVPVLLHPEAESTLPAMEASREAAGRAGQEADAWAIDTLDCDPPERAGMKAALAKGPADGIDPVVSHMVAATCGNLYLKNVGRLARYPVPDFRWKNGNGRRLLDIGCNWGRWSLAAAREGYLPVGVDPQLGAVLAAKRVAEQLGLKAWFICADARHLPFRNGVFDMSFSYSVLQHLSREDAADAASEAARVTREGGGVIVQMPNALGLRCLQQQLWRGFREPRGFEVRYWRLAEMKRLFARCVGPVTLETDCFFGIGLQPADLDLMPWHFRLLIRLSESLRRLSRWFPPLVHVADSVYVHARRTAAGDHAEQGERGRSVAP